jgi:hypothetical protein
VSDLDVMILQKQADGIQSSSKIQPDAKENIIGGESVLVSNKGNVY